MTSWGEWSGCSVECGANGTHTRHRAVRRPARNGGKACSAAEETQTCNSQACPTPVPTPEPTAEPTSIPTVEPTVLAATTAAPTTPVTPMPTVEPTVLAATTAAPTTPPTTAAPTTAPPPPACEVSQWSAWSECSQSCGE